MAGVPGWGVNLVSQSRAHRQNREEAEKDRALRKKLHDRQMNQQLGLALGQMAAKFGGQALTQGISNWRGDREKATLAGVYENTKGIQADQKDVSADRTAKFYEDALKDGASGKALGLTAMQDMPGAPTATAPVQPMAQTAIKPAAFRPPASGQGRGRGAPVPDGNYDAVRRHNTRNQITKAAAGVDPDPPETRPEMLAAGASPQPKEPPLAALSSSITGGVLPSGSVFQAPTGPETAAKLAAYRAKQAPVVLRGPAPAPVTALTALADKATNRPVPLSGEVGPNEPIISSGDFWANRTQENDAKEAANNAALAADPFLRRSLQNRRLIDKKAAMADAELALSRDKYGLDARYKGALLANKRDQHRLAIDKEAKSWLTDQAASEKSTRAELAKYSPVTPKGADLALEMATQSYKLGQGYQRYMGLLDLASQKYGGDYQKLGNSLMQSGYSQERASQLVTRARAKIDTPVRYVMTEDEFAAMKAGIQEMKRRKTPAGGGNTYVKVEQPNTAGDDVNTPGAPSLPTTAKGWGKFIAGGAAKSFPVDPESTDYKVESKRQAKAVVIGKEIAVLMNTIEDKKTPTPVRMQAQSLLTDKRQVIGKMRADHAKGDSFKRRYGADANAAFLRGSDQSPAGRRKTKAKEAKVAKGKTAAQKKELTGLMTSFDYISTDDLKAGVIKTLPPDYKEGDELASINETLDTGINTQKNTAYAGPVHDTALKSLKSAEAKNTHNQRNKIIKMVAIYRTLRPKATQKDFLKAVKDRAGVKGDGLDPLIKANWDAAAPGPAQPQTPQPRKTPGDQGSIQPFIDLRDRVAPLNMSDVRKQALYVKEAKALAKERIRQGLMTASEANELFRGIG